MVIDGRVVAAAHEGRVIGGDPSAPAATRAIAWCLDQLGGAELVGLAHADRPLSTLAATLRLHAGLGPGGYGRVREATRSWSERDLGIGGRLRGAVRAAGRRAPRTSYVERVAARSALAFYLSPHGRAAVLAFADGGPVERTAVSLGSAGRLDLRLSGRGPDGLGALTQAVARFCGVDPWAPGALATLAALGQPAYADVLRSRVVHIGDDGSTSLRAGWTALGLGAADVSFAELVDGPAPPLGATPTARAADLARSLQVLTGEVVISAAVHAHEVVPEPVLCLAGPFPPDPLVVDQLLAEGPFDDVWVPPTWGSQAGALGAALWAWHQLDDEPRPRPISDALAGTRLGPRISPSDLAPGPALQLQEFGSDEALAAAVATRLDAGELVGWIDGRAELGPGTIGHRSILLDPRRPSASDRLAEATDARGDLARPWALVISEPGASVAWPSLDAGPAGTPLERIDDDDQDHPPRPLAPTDLAARLTKAAEGSPLPVTTRGDGSTVLVRLDPHEDGALAAVVAAFEARTACSYVAAAPFARSGHPEVRTAAEAAELAADAGLDALAIGRVLVTRTTASMAAQSASDRSFGRRSS